MYEENSCIYIFTRENLIARRHRISDHPLMYEIPRLEAVDIDTEPDFKIANILMQVRMEN